LFFDDPLLWLGDPDDPASAEPTAFELDDYLASKGLSIHPGGRWIAYASNQGRVEPYQVYVERFPGGGGKRLISVNGGYAPVWSTDGGTLYFQNGGDLLAVDVSLEAGVEPKGAPRTVFHGPYRSNAAITQYDIDPVTGRFLMMRPVSTRRRPPQIIVVLDALPSA
jgi:hypothetical protein